MRKFITISIDVHNNDVWIYIFEFHNICNKLKNMNYEMSNWTINDQFIDNLKTYHTTFIWMKQNEVWNLREKERIIKINLKQLMNQLIIRVMNHKKKKLKSNSKSLKNENILDLKFNSKDNLNSNSNSNPRKSKINNKEKLNDWDRIKICSYCYRINHDSDKKEWWNSYLLQ